MLCFLTLIILTGCERSNKAIQLKSNDSGYVQVDQGKLFYQTFGSGTPIIILHGGPGLDQSHFLPQMLELEKNHKVIFYDQRGSGKSLETKINPSYINIDEFTRDLETLRKQLGIKKFILLGHSWGGFVAMNYAIMYPDNLAALILLSTAPADFRGQQAFVNEFTKRTQPIKDEISPLFNYQEFEKLTASEISKLYRSVFSVYFYHPKDAAELTLTMSAASAKSGAKVMEVMSKTSWLRPSNDLFPQLKKLNVPTLIIHGKQDIIPVWTAQEIKEAIPQAQMLSLEKCGHFPYIEKPDEVFFQINRFLTDIEKFVPLKTMPMRRYKTPHKI
jgi:proline iminopeptidase